MSVKRFNSHIDGLQDDTDIGFDNAFASVAAGATDSSGGGDKHGAPLLKTYISGDPNVPDSQEFNIQINFSGKWTADQQADAIAAANAWSQIIAGDIHDDFDAKGKLVDDIVIDMRIGRIDGLGNLATGVNTLAATDGWVVRDPGTINQLLPLTASIKLDVADLGNPDLSNLWPAIIMHEMGHALGFFGGLFLMLNLLDPALNFSGHAASAAYGGHVPLSSGDFSHWSETTFSPNGTAQPEDLMTPLFALGQQTVLSDTTVAAFQDLGYTVRDPDPHNPYVVLNTVLDNPWLV